MPDYIYLLENRLSADQRNALLQMREAAREAGMLLFLTGDAVRDLTSGHSVRDLEISVHGNALKLKKTIENMGGKVWGEHEATQSLYLCFPGTVRVDVISTHSAKYPQPGKPVYHPASILEDLRRRDFTVNAMAISLNEGSFGLLMDPLNGAADIESRTLRLVSNYGFLEDPSLLIRATRYRIRLGWEFDPRSQSRYMAAKDEGMIALLSSHARSQELEQIGHEEDGLQVLKALEAEGWMKVLLPAWTAAAADEERLKALHELAVELLLQGVHADMSAAQMQLLSAKLAPKDLSVLKKSMLRSGFVEEWNSLDALAAGFAKVLLAKDNAAPSAGYRLFTSYDPEAVLWLGFTSKNATILERFNMFLKVWPGLRQQIPYALMQEMRITPELAGYDDIVHKVFLELIDGRLGTPEEMRTYLEPYSPPAPLLVTVKRPRVKRNAEAKLKEHSFDEDEESEDDLDVDVDLDDIGGEDDDVDLSLSVPKIALGDEIGSDESADEKLDSEDSEPILAAVKPHAKKVQKPVSAPVKTQKPVDKLVANKPVKTGKPQPKPVSKQPVPSGKAKTMPVKPKTASKGKSVAPAAVAAKASKAAAPPAKALSKSVAKSHVKAPVKTPAKQKPLPASASKAGKGLQGAKAAKPANNKPASKTAKKR